MVQLFARVPTGKSRFIMFSYSPLVSIRFGKLILNQQGIPKKSYFRNLSLQFKQYG